MMERSKQIRSLLIKAQEGRYQSYEMWFNMKDMEKIYLVFTTDLVTEILYSNNTVMHNYT